MIRNRVLVVITVVFRAGKLQRGLKQLRIGMFSFFFLGGGGG